MLTWFEKENSRLTWNIVICLSLVIGLFLRLDDIFFWYAQPSLHFFGDNQPILLASDGYYYLNFAHDWLNSASFFPLPPLPSFLVASLSRITGASLDWLAVLLPPILALFFAHAVFVLGREAGGKVVATLTLFFALLSPQYALRSRIGWFDTDVLNVAFATYAAALAMCVYRTERKIWLQLLLLFLNVLLFLWWWDSGGPAVLFLSLAPVALMLSFKLLKLGSRKEKVMFAAIALVLVSSALILVVRRWDALFNLWQYITKTQTTELPNVGEFIAELRGAGSLQSLRISTGGIGSFLLAGLGLGFFVRKHPIEAAALLPLSVVAFLSVTASRFLVFAAPLVGIGLSYLLTYLYQLLQHRCRTKTQALLLCTTTGFLVALTMILPLEAANDQRSIRTKTTVEAMLELRQAVPKNTVLWSELGNGYAFNYFAQLRTVIDGGRHDALRMYATSRPLILTNEQLAAAWMRFYSARDNEGLRKCRRELGNGDWALAIERLDTLLTSDSAEAAEYLREWTSAKRSSEVEEWLDFLHAPDAPPAAFFLDKNFLRTPWFYIGAWDFEQRASVDRLMLPLNPLREFETDEGTILAGINPAGPLQLNLDGKLVQFAAEIFVDPVRGQIESGSYSGKLQYLLTVGEKIEETKFSEHGLCLTYFKENHRGLLLNGSMYKSIFANLYLRQKSPEGYFKSVILQGIDCQVWLQNSEHF